MLRFCLLVLLTHGTRTAYITDPPTFAEKLDKLYEKLEKLSVPFEPEKDLSPEEKLYAKLERLNSLAPDRLELSDDDEELLTAMQVWGVVSADQLGGVMKDLQSMKTDKSEQMRFDGEYGDGDWNDEELQDLAEEEYANDDWDPEDDQDIGSTMKPGVVTPAAIIRQDPGYRDTFLSAVDPIAATNERPRILDDSGVSAIEKAALRRAAIANMGRVVRSGKCLTPQPRWLSVRQLAPAADTVYMPPCVQLHRCAPDAGCCYSEAEVCAPVDGKYIAIPFYLNKADGNFTVARMLFFNHTQCACVSRETLQSTTKTRIPTVTRVTAHVERADKILVDNQQTLMQERESAEKTSFRERQSDWRSPTEEPKLENVEEPTAPPQMRRCTCPGLFMARISEQNVCSCVCEWGDASKRRDCVSLSRGREHFGLRDRVCVLHGDCHAPACEYGPYDTSSGRCPLRRYRRIRYHGKRYQPDKTVVV